MRWWEEENNLEIKDNKLSFAGHRATELARQHGTPLYVYNVDRFAKNYQLVCQTIEQFANGAFGTRVYYAMKANGALPFMERIRRLNGYIDVSSIGEARRALSAGFEPQKLIFTGTNFGLDGFEWLAGSGILVNIDSFSQLKRFRPYAPMKISIRLNTTVKGVGFNEKFDMSGTGIRASRLGIYHDRIMEAFYTAREWGFEPIALHQHSGSNWLRNSSFEAYMQSVDIALDVVRRLEDEGFQLEMLNFGGGLGVRSHEQYPEFPLERFAWELTDRIKRAGTGVKTLAIEPGRYIAGNAGILLATVNMIERKHQTNFLGIDIGFNAFHHKFLYQVENTILNASRITTPQTTDYAVVGYLGESGDVFAENEPLPLSEEGDVIALFPAGAYCASELAEHHFLPVPKEVFLEGSAETVDPLSLLSFCRICPNNCCYGAVINLTESEYLNILARTGREDIFTRTDDGVVQIVNGAGEPCHFFNEETKTCGIQDFKPIECRAYPLMTGRNKGEYAIGEQCPAHKHVSKAYIRDAQRLLDDIPEAQHEKFYQINKQTGFIS
jgi:diaminopimelate decarboxylase